MGRGPRPRGRDAATPADAKTRSRRPALRQLTLAAAISAALALALASSASAVIVHLRHHHAVSYQPLRHAALNNLDAAFSNLEYNGGPVMPSNTNYTLYWAPSGSQPYPAGYKAGVNLYLEGLAHDSGGHENVDSVSSQYNDAAGQFASYESHFGGQIDDTDPYPANGCKQAKICLTDAQLQAELTKFTKEHELPTNLETEYFLLLPPEAETCLEGAICSAGSNSPYYCAYHSNIPLAGGAQLIYAVDGYVGGNYGCDDGNHPNGISDSALEGGLSHEHNESLTDPEPNNAWADWVHEGSEIGDKCRTFSEGSEYGTPLGEENGVRWNQVVDGRRYWYQQEWSNQTAQCLQRFTFSGERPTATFTSAPTTGDAVKFDASGSTAPGGVYRYAWQWNDGPGQVRTTETTSPTISHTFPSAGLYTVALTVFASDGTSIGTAGVADAGAVPPAVSKLAPIKGPASGGTTVTITGKNFVGVTAVHFAGAKATGVTVKSPTSIEATSPAGATGFANVTVTTNAGTSPIVAGDRFKYVPTITALSPSKGPKAGGTAVTVTGSGFALGAGETVFKFGAAKATGVSCTSSSKCTLTTPAHAIATIDVLVVVNKVASAKTPPGDQFTYE